MLNAFGKLKVFFLVILVLTSFTLSRLSLSLEKNKVNKGVNFRIIIFDRFSLWDEPYLREYEIGNVKIKVLPNSSKRLGSRDAYFEIYSKDRRVFKSEKAYFISNIFALEYNENKYLVINYDPSGGMHCCFTPYIFLIDKNDNVKLIKKFREIDISTSLDPINFFIKNNKLYVSWSDPRFTFFDGLAFAYSPTFERFFLIENEKVIEVSKDFKEDYLKEASEYEKEIRNIIGSAKKMSKEKLREEKDILYQKWFSRLLAKTVNLIMAGEKEKAFKEFDRSFEEFYSLSKSYYESRFKEKDKIKKEILERMKELIE
jgi:hypothetical protein